MNNVNLCSTLSVVKDDTPWLDEQENLIWRSFLHASG
ncbi:MAG: hypothetical protein ACI9TF_000868, partial [Paracrocinitomix sp.]